MLGGNLYILIIKTSNQSCSVPMQCTII